MSQYLAWDRPTRSVVQGKQRLPLSQDEFFTLLGRPEFIERAQTLRTRRVLLATGAAVSLVAGIAANRLILAQSPDLNSPFCVASARNYNEVCLARASAVDTTALVALLAGVAGAGVLGSLAYWSDPAVLSDDETQAAISSHNAALLARLREVRGLRLGPAVDGSGVRLVLQGSL